MRQRFRDLFGVAADVVTLVPIGFALVAAGVVGAYLELQRVSPAWTVIVTVGLFLILGGATRLAVRWFRNRFDEIGEESYVVHKRIHLTALVTTHVPVVEDRTFDRCRFIGPAVIVLDGGTLTGGRWTGPIDNIFIEYEGDHAVIGPLVFKNCAIRDCKFEGVGVIGTPIQIARYKAGFDA